MLRDQDEDDCHNKNDDGVVNALFLIRYKSKASVECPSNPWNIQNHAIFYRLDALLDRCHDVLEIVNIIVNFSVLETATIGGSKGKVLSTSVRQIYADFLVAQNAFRNTECVPSAPCSMFDG